jgi:hypothetical protein
VASDVVGDGMSGRSPRRWPRRLAAGIGTLVLVVGGVYAWAWLSVGSSTTARAMIWMGADVDDQHRFPFRVIPAGDHASELPDGAEIDLTGSSPGGDEDFDAFLRQTETLAFVVVHKGGLVYERYFDGSKRATLLTSF